jgi:hypothetical protein
MAILTVPRVRRFLEQFSAANRRGDRASEADLSHVLCVLDDAKDLEICVKLLLMYFQRHGHGSDAQFQKEHHRMSAMKQEACCCQAPSRCSFAMPGRDGEYNATHPCASPAAAGHSSFHLQLPAYYCAVGLVGG